MFFSGTLLQGDGEVAASLLRSKITIFCDWCQRKSVDDVCWCCNSGSHDWDIPAVAIECKTYLDKTMLQDVSTAAEQLKQKSQECYVYRCCGVVKLD